MLIMPSISH